MVADQQPHTPDRQKQHIVDLLAGYSIEITPAIAAKYASVADLLPAGTRVYVAFVPGDDYRVVAATAKRLRAEGLVPVPHFPARSITGRAELDDYLARVTGEAGVDEVLAIGGGLDQPQGAFSGTLDLLETGLFEARGVRVIGVAGHPEGQRELRLPGIAMPLDQKLGYAERSTARMRFVTQFLFDADPLLAWERALRARGNALPIHVGVPGPAKITTLLNYARLCGVGNSMRMLTRQTGSLFKLASVSCPDVLLSALAEHRAETPESRVERVHVYPFGGLARTAAWI
ncbi:MAG: metFprotein, partial [Geminicoccales bacterium]